VSAPADALELDMRVHRKLGVRPHQSIQARCRELLKQRTGTTGQEQMATILLDESLEPWEAMRRADAVFAEKVTPMPRRRP
jgi:hypothetical protein